MFLSFLTTPIIGAIFRPVVDGLLTAQKQKLDAAGSTEARVAEITQRALTLDQREAELNAETVRAEQGNAFTRWVRPMWAAPFVLFTWKIVVWDKMLGWGTTDPLDPNMWSVFMLMVGAYFGGRSAEKVASTIAKVMRK